VLDPLVLQRYTDRESAPAETARVVAHAARCAECSAEIRAAEERRALFAALAQRDPIPSVWRRALRRHRARRLGTQLRRPRWWALAAALAAAALILLPPRPAEALDLALYARGLHDRAAAIRFAARYSPRPIAWADARRQGGAPIPQQLPGGFQLRRAYRLRCRGGFVLELLYRGAVGQIALFEHAPAVPVRTGDGVPIQAGGCTGTACANYAVVQWTACHRRFEICAPTPAALAPIVRYLRRLRCARH
jgi:hypothetical protein